MTDLSDISCHIGFPNGTLSSTVSRRAATLPKWHEEGGKISPKACGYELIPSIKHVKLCKRYSPELWKFYFRNCYMNHSPQWAIRLILLCTSISCVNHRPWPRWELPAGRWAATCSWFDLLRQASNAMPWSNWGSLVMDHRRLVVITPMKYTLD